MMDVYVCASLSESFSIGLVEAMAAKRAVVSTDCGGPREFIRDAVNGFIIPTEDAPYLAGKILHMIENPSLREKLGQQAGKDIRKYDINKTVRMMEDVFSDVYETAFGKTQPDMEGSPLR
jgi:glycosyltransferase involved in cell wall biosynthesis